MIKGMLANFFSDINNWVNDNIGGSTKIIILVVLSMCALLIFANVIKSATGKSKISIKWGQILRLIILVVAIVWLSTTL